MKTAQVTAAFLMALGVASGAFGAHALRDSVPVPDLLIWEKAVLYQLIHALAALCVASSSGLLMSARARLAITWMLLVSIVIFSGTLYVLVLANMRWLGMITPLGGSGFIAAWLLLAFQLLKAPPNGTN
jgi:uncharacterized membrane protein YgdD (TMEM256/DUF423 family)